MRYAFTLLILATLFKYEGHECKAQDSRLTNGCVVINKQRPSIYITFERIERRKHKIWLRLHNNLSCGVVLDTEDIYPESPEYKPYFRKQPLTFPDGQTGAQYIFDPPIGGAVLPLNYDYQDVMHRTGIKPATYWLGRDQVFFQTLPSDRSVVFSVDSKYLRKGYRILVHIKYEWESDEGDGAPLLHWVSYSYLNLKYRNSERVRSSVKNFRS